MAPRIRTRKGTSMTTVLAIDPSLTRTAVAILEPSAIQLCDIPTKGAKDATLLQRSQRITGIVATVMDLTRRAAPIDLVVIEGPSFAQKAQGGTHDRAGLWWRIVAQMHVGGLDIVTEVPPTCRATYATGKGNAGKDEVMLATARRYGHLADVQNNDQADALVLAAMGWHMVTGSPLVDLPQTHTRALAKVVRPEGLADATAGPMPGVAS